MYPFFGLDRIFYIKVKFVRKDSEKRSMLDKILPLLLFVVSASCGQSQFIASEPNRRLTKKNATSEGAPGRASSQSAGEAAGYKSATLQLTPNGTPNDLLFVFDNSVSMGEYLNNVRRGFERLGSADWVPDTRIAVMTTMPGNPGNLGQPHRGIERYTGIESEPGFLSFVSNRQAVLFKGVSSSPESGAYPEPLCVEEWFTPTSTNASGKRCLSVALQNPYSATVCEAGMTAVSQLLDKKGKVFRDGAFAQIVFISDAQDPGCQNADLIRLRPKPDALKSKILEKNNLLGVRFHGALPVPGGALTKETKREGNFNFPYNQLVADTKGVLVDITRSSDYSGFAQSLAKSSSVAAVTLPEKATRVKSVSFAGNALKPGQWQLSADGLRVIFPGITVDRRIEVSLQYFK